MTDLLAGFLMVTGSIFMLLASIGLLRMPDIFMRMQSATKAYTLGPLLILGGAALWFGTLDVVARVLIVILFLFVTAPVAGHLVGRAAYRRGLLHWTGTTRDEIREFNGAPSGRNQSCTSIPSPESRSRT